MIIMLAGLPGCGKSYLAQALKEQLPDAILIQSDVVRHELFSNPCYEGWEHAKVFGYIHDLIDSSVSENKDVIYDATNRKKYERKTVYKIAAKYDVPVVLVHVNTPEGIILERLKAREFDDNKSDAGVEVYMRMSASAFQTPEFYLEVDGSDNVAANIELIKEYIHNVWFPFTRTGDMICNICHVKYSKHPSIVVPFTDNLVLNKICDRYVKL